MITRERYQYYLMFDYLSRMVNSIQTTEFVICLDLPFFVNCALTPIRECDNGKKIQLIFVFFFGCKSRNFFRNYKANEIEQIN